VTIQSDWMVPGASLVQALRPHWQCSGTWAASGAGSPIRYCDCISGQLGRVNTHFVSPQFSKFWPLFTTLSPPPPLYSPHTPLFSQLIINSARSLLQSDTSNSDHIQPLSSTTRPHLAPSLPIPSWPPGPRPAGDLHNPASCLSQLHVQTSSATLVPTSSLVRVTGYVIGLAVLSCLGCH
jgi:hypothetical protein